MQEIIEREFNAAMSEKAATGLSSAGTSSMTTSRPGSPQVESLPGTDYQRQHSGGIIASAVQNLRSRSIKRRNVKSDSDWKQPQVSAEQAVCVYEHIYSEPGGVTTFSAVPSIQTTAVTIETDITDDVVEMTKLRRTQSMSTNTPPLLYKGTDADDISGQEPARKVEFAPETKQPLTTTEPESVQQLGMPIKPPRRKSSRSTSPSSRNEDLLQGRTQAPAFAYNVSLIRRRRRILHETVCLVARVSAMNASERLARAALLLQHVTFLFHFSFRSLFFL